MYKLPVQSETIIAKVVSSNPAHGEVYSIQHYAIKFVSDLRQQGRIHDFKLGGADLKKLRRAEGGAKIFEVFRVKNHDFTPKKIIFLPILGGARAGCAPPPPPPLNPPLDRSVV